MAEKHHSSGVHTEDTGSGWVLKGNHLYHSGAYAEALKCYLEALRKEHHKTAIWNIHNRLCATYTRLQDFESSLDEANKMISEDPEHPKGHIRKGGALFFLGRYEEALQEYDRARGLMTAAHAAGIVTMEQAENLKRYTAAAKAKLAEKQ